MTLLFCFLKGLAISLIFGIPAGAIGVLTIRRTLSNGFFNGLCTGLGSTAADLIYSSVGIFGLSLVSNFYQHLQFSKSLRLQMSRAACF